MWYVIQTETGREQYVRRLIQEIVPSELYEDCRILFYESKRKYLGEWHLEKKILFPGYLFLAAGEEDIVSVFFKLKRVPRLTKLLRHDAQFLPLYRKEEDCLKRLCGEDGTADFSLGVQEGDSVRVVKGCLKGMESRIVHIDRHKRKARIELEILGEKREVEVGLEIVRKRTVGQRTD